MSKTLYLIFDWDLVLFPICTNAGSDALTMLPVAQSRLEVSDASLNAYIIKLRAMLHEYRDICHDHGWILIIVTRNSETNVRNLLKKIVRIDDTQFQIISEPSREHNKLELVRMHVKGVNTSESVFILVEDSKKELYNAAMQARAWNTLLYMVRVEKPVKGAKYTSAAYGLMNQPGIVANVSSLLDTYK